MTRGRRARRKRSDTPPGTRPRAPPCLAVLSFVVWMPLHPLLRGVTAVSITRAGLQTCSASCPFPPPCGGSGSLHEAIRELTAAGQSGTHTPFPINRRDANPDTAKVTLPPQSAKGNGRFLPSQATERRGDGTRAPEGYKQRREGDRRRARTRKCTRMTAAGEGRRGSARLSK